MGETCGPYRRRALQYGQLDQELGYRSRFLAAASIVSHALSAVERYAFFVVGRPGVGLLSHINASLCRLNLEIVDRLGGAGVSADLDERWVRLEQSAVQEILRTRRDAQPDRFEASMRGIDRLLALAALRIPIASPQSRFLADVIRTVSRDYRRPLRFADQGHRERIGFELIAKIRGRSTASDCV